jgi:beta-lactamase superfamily II metal-dependent hydrolase
MALNVFQVPHHGSRNNISPSLLDRIVGGIAGLRTRTTIGCVISAGPEDETHPRQVVVNALLRRGLEPQDTKKGILLFNHGVPNRAGFGPAPSLQFASKVEAYE